MTNKNRQTKILLACMPKSGSTFLSTLIAELPDMRRVHLVPAYQRREQEIENGCIVRANQQTQFLRQMALKGKLADNTPPSGWIAQHHVRYSAHTSELIKRHDIKPVILVRDIFDIVASLHDHINDSSPFMAMGFVSEDYPLDSELLKEFIVEMVIPWYFNFFVSWVTQTEAPLVSYEELISDPEIVVSGLFKRWGKKLDPDSLAAALERASKGKTRKNKGVRGRGQSLPDSAKERISGYTRFYPHVDFSIIGL